MTHEMAWRVLEVALTRLMEEPPDLLHAYEPWLTPDHIGYCLDHLHDFRVTDEAEIAARWHRKAAAQKGERSEPASPD